VAKTVSMTSGVPVQAVEIETIEQDDLSLPWSLNNIALAIYAKLGGVPWTISTRDPTSHELVVGIGCAEVAESRLSTPERFVGITTVFQGDGRYLVWDQTREVAAKDYQDALLESLQGAIQHVQHENGWKEGDHVRLIFHVYKPLKHVEIEAVKTLVRDLTERKYNVRFAFLDISEHHPYELFDLAQQGVGYRGRRKGEGVPVRGTSIQLGPRAALLQLGGPNDVKTELQGLPRPLLLEIHPLSDFDDLPYLTRQIYNFAYMSWRSFFPAKVPVTIGYSRRIATMLGGLKAVTGWQAGAIRAQNARGGKWFL
jgi:hypothetical protein